MKNRSIPKPLAILNTRSMPISQLLFVGEGSCGNYGLGIEVLYTAKISPGGRKGKRNLGNNHHPAITPRIRRGPAAAE